MDGRDELHKIMKQLQSLRRRAVAMSNHSRYEVRLRAQGRIVAYETALQWLRDYMIGAINV